MGLLDGLLGGGDSSSDPYAGLLNPAQRDAVNSQGLRTLAASLLAASGPSRMPVNLGQAVGQGLLTSQQAQNDQRDRMLKDSLLGAQVGALQRQAALQQWKLNLLSGGDSPSPVAPMSSGGLLGGAPGAPVSGGGSLLGGGASAPTINTVPNPVAQPSSGANPAISGSAPPPSTGGGNPLGLNLPPGANMRSLMAADVLFGDGTAGKILASQYPGPTDIAKLAKERDALAPNDPNRAIYDRAIAEKAGLGFQNVRQGGAVFDPLTGKPLFQNPQLPMGAIYDNRTNTAIPVQNADALFALQKGIEQGAIGAREKGVAGYKDVLETGPFSAAAGPAGSNFSVGGGMGTGPRGSGAPSAAPRTPVQTQPLPPLGAAEPIKTDAGTLVPPASAQSKPLAAGSYLKEALPQWAKTEGAMSEAAPAMEQGIQRLNTISDMFKLTQGGSFATSKAQLAGGLIALGVPKDSIPEMLGDPAAVQTILHENAVKTLSQLKATTSRFTQMEFKSLSGNAEHPDLQPEANLQQLAEDIGTLKQGLQMTRDYFNTAKGQGWANPQEYAVKWQQLNPLSGFVDQTKAQIGRLKGMPGGPGTAGPAPSAPAPKPIDDQTRNAAQNAIMRGAPRDAVVKRLQESGYDVSKF
jgi:hypothetical protein